MFRDVTHWAMEGFRPMVRALRGPASVDPYGRDNVGYLRYLQNRRETGVRKNPDGHVRFFLKTNVKLAAMWTDIARHRRDAFYHYLLARTKFYDEVFLNAISDGVRQIFIVGAGTDTRAYRFNHERLRHHVSIFETDLDPWISERSVLARRMTPYQQIHRSRLDLARDRLPTWANEVNFDPKEKTLLMAEGVTPYLPSHAVHALLGFMTEYSPAGSWLAYDFKRLNVKGTAFGEQTTFRLPSDIDGIKSFHKGFELVVENMFLSENLGEKYLGYDAPKYTEDVVLIATVQR